MKLQQKTVPLNMVTSLVSQVVTMLSGLIVQRYILLAFGSTYNGLTSLVAQIISYLVLLEAGIGAASTQALYHPLNEGDWNAVNGIMNATAKSYRQVGYMFSALLVGAALLIPLTAIGEIDFIVAAVITLISGGGNVITYMISGKYTAFLTADRKTYVRYVLTIVSTLASAVLRILALQNGCGIIFVQSINLACIFLHSLVLWLYVRRRYPRLDRSVSPNLKAIRKRWNVLIHSLAGLVVTHTDMLILPIANSLKMVSVYNVYNMVYSHIGYAIQTVFQYSLQGNFGRLLDKDKKGFERMYAIYETLFTILVFIIATLAVLLTLPFIKLYTGGITDVQYVDFWLPLLFVVVFLFNYVRTPALVTINAAGMFKETQAGAIIEMVIKLTASLALFFFTDLGMHGLLLGTVISFLFRTTDVFVFVYRHILERSGWQAIRLLLVNAGVFAAFVYVGYVVWPISADSFITWAIAALVLGVIAVPVFILINLLLNYQDTKQVLAFALSKIRKQHS